MVKTLQDRHYEHSEAIQKILIKGLDCRAAVAMTVENI